MIFTMASTVLGLSLIVVLVYFLKNNNVLTGFSAAFVNSLLLNIILPANIIHELMQVPLNTSEFTMAFIFIIEIIIILIITYLFGTIFRYKRSVIGAFMLSTAFSSQH